MVADSIDSVRRGFGVIDVFHADDEVDEIFHGVFRSVSLMRERVFVETMQQRLPCSFKAFRTGRVSG